MAFNLFAKDNAATRIEAIHRSQAMIECDVTGAILFANIADWLKSSERGCAPVVIDGAKAQPAAAGEAAPARRG